MPLVLSCCGPFLLLGLGLLLIELSSHMDDGRK